MGTQVRTEGNWKELMGTGWELLETEVRTVGNWSEDWGEGLVGG